jgi:hypothetical protein
MNAKKVITKQKLRISLSGSSTSDEIPSRKASVIANKTMYVTWNKRVSHVELYHANMISTSSKNTQKNNCERNIKPIDD